MTLLDFLFNVGAFAGYGFACYYLGRQSVERSSVDKLVAASKCGNAYCGSRGDPRCASGNCTEHCQSTFGCKGRCLDAWAKGSTAGDIARQMLEKARR